MEIKTCEAYVLQQLHDALETIESLKLEVDFLRRDLDEMRLDRDGWKITAEDAMAKLQELKGGTAV